jgi:hypothetical protein
MENWVSTAKMKEAQHMGRGNNNDTQAAYGSATRSRTAAASRHRRPSAARLAPVSTGWLTHRSNRSWKTSVNIARHRDGVICWEKRVADGVAINDPLYRGNDIDSAVAAANDAIGDLVELGYVNDSANAPNAFSASAARAVLS